MFVIFIEGDTCVGKSYEGVCKKTRDCRAAIEQIKMYRSHSFTTCNFDKFEEIVCCPDDESSSSSSSSSTTEKLDTEFREPDIVRRCELGK